MVYRDFETIKDVKAKFPITVSSAHSLFTDVEVVEPSAFLQEALTENIPIALNVNTEKAQSELIITPILIEVRKLFDRRINFFSGVDFTIDQEVGLSGYCDYILSASPEKMFIAAPIICMVEAKNERISSAYGQCLAEMIAAQRFHQAEANNQVDTNLITTVWGAATTGTTWRFLRLEGNDARIDPDEYPISQVDKLLGIFRHMVKASHRAIT